MPCKASLPPGVEVVTTYDRSQLIDRAVDDLTSKLIEEFIVVAVICGLFLWHVRSALVAIVTLPLGVLTALLIMRIQGVNANIMSLGGIAIAIGAMVDAAIVMIENAHKRIERWEHDHRDTVLAGEQRWNVVTEAAVEVGPALFFSLVIITLSFVPVFTLEAQEGKLFAPLAFTKSYAMAAAAILSVTLVPVLMGWLIRGRIPAENNNILNRTLTHAYRPALARVMARPWMTIGIAAVVLASAAWPLTRLGGEFIPSMDEGDLLYMPSALPGLSAATASVLLQRTDRLIKTVPEVATVFGKAGRAETATDPAPLEMFETTIQFKPRDQWRAGMTPSKLVEELDHIVRVPGLLKDAGRATRRLECKGRSSPGGAARDTVQALTKFIGQAKGGSPDDQVVPADFADRVAVAIAAHVGSLGSGWNADMERWVGYFDALRASLPLPEVFASALRVLIAEAGLTLAIVEREFGMTARKWAMGVTVPSHNAEATYQSLCKRLRIPLALLSPLLWPTSPW